MHNPYHRELIRSLHGFMRHHPDVECVPRQRREQMAASLETFVVQAVDKYFKGQKEHGGDICDRDLDVEIRHEQIDQFWFSEAMKWKKQQ